MANNIVTLQELKDFKGITRTDLDTPLQDSLDKAAALFVAIMKTHITKTLNTDLEVYIPVDQEYLEPGYWRFDKSDISEVKDENGNVIDSDVYDVFETMELSKIIKHFVSLKKAVEYFS